MIIKLKGLHNEKLNLLLIIAYAQQQINKSARVPSIIGKNLRLILKFLGELSILLKEVLFDSIVKSVMLTKYVLF